MKLITVAAVSRVSEAYSLITREDHRLMTSENEMLTRRFRHMGQETTEGW